VVSFTPLPLYPRGKSSRYPLYRRLDGSKNPSGRHGEVNIPAPPRFELGLRPPARSQSLYRLSYIRQKINIYKFLVGRVREKIMSLERPRLRVKIILKCVSEKLDVRMWAGVTQVRFRGDLP
jgi:hypothetical protein